MKYGKWNDREFLTGGLLVLAVFVFLFWRYPFDGMTLSDSWFFYANDGGPFRWYNNAVTASQTGADPYELSVYHPDWSTVFGNRGLIPVIAWGLSLFPLQDRQVGANIVAIAVQILNVGLFGLVVLRLGGARIARASVICGILYPFAAASHFWQFLMINNLATTGFLIAALAFVAIDHGSPRLSARTIALGLLTLVSFWTSMIVTAYAVFMAPVFVYLAFALANGDPTIKARRRLTPGMMIAILAVAMSIAAILLFRGAVPSFLGYSVRYQELGTNVGLPWQVVGAGAVLGSGALTFLSAVFSNTAGLVVYPLQLLVRNFAILRESGPVIIAIAALAAFATVLLAPSASPRPAALPARRVRVLYTVGALWAVFAYLPFMTAFGYPRVVGLMADRVNILASWGVCLCLGVFISELGASRLSSRARIALPVTLFFVLGLWLANVHVQKTYWVQAYQKERSIALAALAEPATRPGPDGRAPVVLLRRATTVKYPRERLLVALQGGGFHRAAGVLEFVFRRYFVDKYTTSSFDLDGLMLFGCCPETAFMAVDGYAHLLKIPTVPVYKDEPPLRLEQTDSEFQLSYDETGVTSRGANLRVARYSKATHRLVWFDLDESFFTLQRNSDRTGRPNFIAPRRP